MQLAEEAFDVRNDPKQLDVDESVISRFVQIDPAAVSELANEDGPYCWILLIPTWLSWWLNSWKVRFQKRIVQRTPVGGKYESNRSVFGHAAKEFRHRGIAGLLALDAIAQIRSRHHIRTLFVWPFSEEGKNRLWPLRRRRGCRWWWEGSIHFEWWRQPVCCQVLLRQLYYAET